MSKKDHTEHVEQIRGRLRQSFSSTYLTLLSIIQGTALVILFDTIERIIETKGFHTWTSFGIPQLILSLGLFLVITLLWHQYQMGVMLYNWTPQLLDTFIPFTFGVCEFIAILGLEYGATLTLITTRTMFALAIGAFRNQYLQVQATTNRNAIIHRIHAGFQVRDEWSCIISSFVLLTAGALSFRSDSSVYASF